MISIHGKQNYVERFPDVRVGATTFGQLALVKFFLKLVHAGGWGANKGSFGFSFIFSLSLKLCLRPLGFSAPLGDNF